MGGGNVWRGMGAGMKVGIGFERAGGGGGERYGDFYSVISPDLGGKICKICM